MPTFILYDCIGMLNTGIEKLFFIIKVAHFSGRKLKEEKYN